MNKGRLQLLLLTTVFLLTEIFFNYITLTNGNGTVAETTSKTLFFLLFILLFSKRINWAKWILSAALTLYGLLCLIVGFELMPAFYLIGLYDIFFAISIHKSKALSVFRTSEAIKLYENKETFTSDGEHFQSPPLITRYKAFLTDILFLFTVLIIVMVLVDDSPARTEIMVTCGLLSTCVYEPLLTTYSRTLGQRLMKIRVVQHANPSQKINLLNALIRLFVKVMLGWLSFITIHFNPEKRAIHDLASGSVMIREK